MQRRIEEIDRFQELQFRCFLSTDDEKWKGLETHLNKFIEFEDFLMNKYKFSRTEANVYIGDEILNKITSDVTSDLDVRLVKVNLIKLLLSRFSEKEGFDISESFLYIYNFQEEEKVLIMSVMFGMREELLYY